VTVQGGGTLQGAGAAEGLAVAGTVSPGEIAGDCDVLTDFGTMTWQEGGAYECDIAATTGTPSLDWDCLQPGVPDIAAWAEHPFAIRLNTPAGGLAGFDPAQSYTWDVVQTQTGVTGLSDANVAADASGFEGAGDGSSFSVEATGDGAVAVRYTPAPSHTVTPSVTGGHGSISPAGAQTIKWGATPTFTFSPDAGYHVAQVLVDGNPVAMTGAGEYTFAAVKADHTISVSFALSPSTTVNGVRGGWTRHPVDLSFVATPADGGAPVAYTEYCVGSGAWTRGTSVSVTAQGVTTVYHRSANTEGNVEVAHSMDVCIDGGRPVVTTSAGRSRGAAVACAATTAYVMPWRRPSLPAWGSLATAGA
jgi:hypothetical protein